MFAHAKFVYSLINPDRLYIAMFIYLYTCSFFSFEYLYWKLLFVLQAHSQSRKSSGRLKRERFNLNLEDGYFSCQLNESTDYLQVFELSKLCDGHPDCFLGSDEQAKELKCTRKFICYYLRCTFWLILFLMKKKVG